MGLPKSSYGKVWNEIIRYGSDLGNISIMFCGGSRAHLNNVLVELSQSDALAKHNLTKLIATSDKFDKLCSCMRIGTRQDSHLFQNVQAIEGIKAG